MSLPTLLWANESPEVLDAVAELAIILCTEALCLPSAPWTAAQAYQFAGGRFRFAPASRHPILSIDRMTRGVRLAGMKRALHIDSFKIVFRFPDPQLVGVPSIIYVPAILIQAPGLIPKEIREDIRDGLVHEVSANLRGNHDSDMMTVAHAEYLRRLVINLLESVPIDCFNANVSLRQADPWPYQVQGGTIILESVNWQKARVTLELTNGYRISFHFNRSMEPDQLRDELLQKFYRRISSTVASSAFV